MFSLDEIYCLAIGGHCRVRPSAEESKTSIVAQRDAQPFRVAYPAGESYRFETVLDSHDELSGRRSQVGAHAVEQLAFLKRVLASHGLGQDQFSECIIMVTLLRLEESDRYVSTVTKLGVIVLLQECHHHLSDGDTFFLSTGVAISARNEER
jgi:hypothetical protein